MPTPLRAPRTRLGAAIRERRGATGQADAAKVIGVLQATLSNIERGAHYPSPRTARLLATWLGWTVGQVFDAAEQAVSDQ